MEAALRFVRYRIEIGQKAEAQLAQLGANVGASIERKILWLADNAGEMVHRRLVGMPEDLHGLCKLRVGDYRILYLVYPQAMLIRIYRIQHRSEVYKQL